MKNRFRAPRGAQPVLIGQIRAGSRKWQKLIRIVLRLAEPMRNIQKHRVRQARLRPEPTTA
jgi:hypothetical protein